MKLRQTLITLAALLAVSVNLATAQSVEKPSLYKFIYPDNSIVMSMSDNGAWGIAQPGTQEATKSAKPKLVNLSTKEATELAGTAGYCSASDVTDDGSIVVGSYQGMPAYWSKATGNWKQLPAESGGTLTSVTPDGKYAVGFINLSSEGYTRRGVMYDLATGTEVKLENIPTKDVSHEAQNQTQYNKISADGRYICASMSVSYPGGGACSYIYDRTTKAVDFIGYTTHADDAAWQLADADCEFIDGAVMSDNGKWVTGMAYSTSNQWLAYKYNVETKEFDMYKAGSDADITGFAITNEGTLFGASPSSTPLRNWFVRHGNYWYSIDDIFTQRYGTNFASTTNYENTGFPTAVSTDGKTFVATTSPSGESYMVTFPETLDEACNSINLLSGYTVTPTPGAAVARIPEVQILFTRDIEFIGNLQDVTLKSESGTLVGNAISGTQVMSDGKTLSVAFKKIQTLEAGKTYIVNIPAGTLCIKGDRSSTNEQIEIKYTARENKAVAYTKIFPNDGTEVTMIDNSSNPVQIAYDTQVKKSDNAAARLINKTDGKTVCDLSMNVLQGNILVVYPATKQYLYKGTDYQVVIDSGAVTDLAGYGASQAITLNYTGAYERELPTDDENLFLDDFTTPTQSYSTFMRYEGDHNTPTDEMKALGFTDADNYPWTFLIRDNTTSTDFCAGSTSSYSPAGKSDDWMVIPQLTIPDGFCTLSFKGQSYKKDKADRLKVIVYTAEENINTLTKAIIDKMKSEGDVVFDEQLSPGAKEETLAGDWKDYAVDLAKYSGKKIYIAFVNENEDQSIVFVDSINVKRNLKYLMSLTSASSVVAKENINIAGTLTSNSDFDTFTSATLTLLDGEGNQVGGKFEKTGLALKKGDKLPFEFTTPLPLKVGVANKYAIKIQLDNYSDTKSLSVKNLAFEPEKKVILEEQTGTTCANCPFGIVAIENLRELYGNKVIPISLHTYAGDPYGAGVTGYANELFNGDGTAPMGMVNRNGVISKPIYQSLLTGAYSFSNPKDKNCWLDFVEEEINTPADAEIKAGITLDETANTFKLPVDVRYAMNASNLSLNLFVTVLEDSIIANQSNNRGGETDPLLGEWGKGGKYSEADNYNIRHDDVARAYYSSSITGISGQLPQTVTAGEVYNVTFNPDIPANVSILNHAKAVVMLIDANTGKVINATVAYFDPAWGDKWAGIKDVTGDGASGNVKIRTDNGSVTVLTDGNANVSLYTISGTRIAQARTSGAATISANGYRGPVIVKVNTANGTTVKKLILR